MNKSLHEGSTGQAYGLDMTDEMLALARENQRNSKLGAAGFDGIDIEPTRIYSIEDAGTFLRGRGATWRP